MRKFSVVILSAILVSYLTLNIGFLPAVASAAEPSVQPEAAIQTAWANAFNKLADPDTSDAAGYFSPSVIQNGQLWTDKSVNADEATIYDSSGNAISSVAADPDQFLITLSALSESYAVDSVVKPIDAVFVVDISGSMTYFPDSETEGTIGNRRCDAMVDALNTATEKLMEANPENRVSVVAYGGLSGRQPRAYPILGLGHYSTGDGKGFFSIGGTLAAPTFNVNSTITGGPATLNSGVPISGGTPTQRGIYAGAQMLMNNADTTYTDPSTGQTVTRQPVMILMTDGEPTFGWNDYKTAGVTSPGDYTLQNQDWGDALTPDMGIDILTVATAAYWKQEVRDHYYGSDLNGQVQYYTIGMFVNNTHTISVLDPSNANGAPLNEQDLGGTTYNMADILNDFTTTGSMQFPALDMKLGGVISTTRTLTPVITNDGDYVTSCLYSDGYFQADNAADLEKVFESITSQMVTHGGYITDIGSGDPNFSGYLTFSDVIGQYMEFKSFQGLWFEDTHYDGQAFAQDICSQGTASPNWNSFIDNLAKQMTGDAVPVDNATAAAVVESSIAGGSLYYNSPSDYQNQVKWYADNEKNYAGPYFEPDGSLAPVPAD
ncbi:MAG: VWA domain-containing protein, partial [Coriobacteriia bacterium]|nr:VWA domain-containing protein [Coriobacteriia bacterium]